MTSKRLGLLAMIIAAAVVIFASAGGIRSASVDLREARARRSRGVASSRAGRSTTRCQKTDEALRKARRQDRTPRSPRSRPPRPTTRATATDPKTQPPTARHRPARPGRRRGRRPQPEQRAPARQRPDGKDSRRGRHRRPRARRARSTAPTTVTSRSPSLFGYGDRGRRHRPGETKNGPLQTVQTGILDPLCTSTNQQVCLSVLTAELDDDGHRLARTTSRSLAPRCSVSASAPRRATARSARTPPARRPRAPPRRRTSRRGGGAVASVANVDDDVEVLPRRGAAGHEHLARSSGSAARRCRSRPPVARTARPTRSAGIPGRAADRLQRRGHRRRGRRPRGARRLRAAGRRELAAEGDDGRVRGDQRRARRGETGPAVLRQRSTTTATA